MFYVNAMQIRVTKAEINCPAICGWHAVVASDFRYQKATVAKNNFCHIG